MPGLLRSLKKKNFFYLGGNPVREEGAEKKRNEHRVVPS
jgi:hypothetical protein